MATINLDWNSLPHLVDYTRVRQGDSIDKTYALLINSVAKDLSGGGVAVTLDVEAADGTSKISGRTITPGGASNNEVSLGITAADTAAWAEGVYTYRVKLVLPSGDATFSAGATKTLVAGAITVVDEV